jgi:hypothetical protein
VTASPSTARAANRVNVTESPLSRRAHRSLGAISGFRDSHHKVAAPEAAAMTARTAVAAATAAAPRNSIEWQSTARTQASAEALRVVKGAVRMNALPDRSRLGRDDYREGVQKSSTACQAR